MAEFAFTAQDKAGNSVNGRVYADDPTEASSQIDRMGYTPIHLEPVGAPLAVAEPLLPARAPEPSGAVQSPADVTITAPPEAFTPG